MDRKPQTLDKFILRLPDGMRDAIKRAAEENQRSMNAEIVARLKLTLDNQDALEWLGRAGSELDLPEVQSVLRRMDTLIGLIEGDKDVADAIERKVRK